MGKILIPILVLVVLGFVLGFVISFVSKKFYVEEDTRLKTIESMLPGANCGQCGNPGCSGYAERIFNKEASTNLCTVISKEKKEELDNYVKENL